MTPRAKSLPLGDPECALEEALRITPSPEFVARVRERVREEPAGAATGWRPKLALAAAVMALIVTAAVWSVRSGPDRADVASRTTARTSAKAPPTAIVAKPAGAPPRITAGRPSRSHTMRAAAAPLNATRVTVGDQAHAVLVPDDERRALDRLLIAMRDGRAAIPAPRRLLEDENGHLADPRPIEIPLMKPIDLLPGTAADRSGSKDR